MRQYRFERMLESLRQNADLVLCSIIASSGSTPRGSGAKMAVFADGSIFGTVGGGAMEYESIRCAKEALRERSAFTKGFDLSSDQTADFGMICGGKVAVYFQYLAGNDSAAIAILAHIVLLYGGNDNAWLVTQITEGGVRQMGIYEEGCGLRFADIPVELIKPLLKSRGMLKKGEPSYYVEPLVQAGTVLCVWRRACFTGARAGHCPCGLSPCGL